MRHLSYEKALNMYHYKPENSIWQGALFSSIFFHKLKLDLMKNLT